VETILQRWPWGILMSTAGAGVTLVYLSKGVPSMEGQHWIMLLVVLTAGYVAGRIWTTPARIIGLP
jgi:hypothetical protein